MIGFDFEVFRYDWLVVFKDLISNKYTIIKNNKEELKKYLDKNKSSLFIGYNNSNYDNYILKSILLDIDPYYVSSIIINKDKSGRIYRLAKWSDINFYSYDVSFGLGFTSLKENEAYLGISIDECPIDFNQTNSLTYEQWDKVIEYCKRDVDATCLLFEKTQSEFETKLYLCNEFGLDKSYLNKGNQAIIERVLGAERKFNCTDANDPFDFSQLNLKIKKYKKVIEYFSQPTDMQKGLELDICGVPHTFGIGGIHGAIPNFSYSGKLMNIDVASYYPSMMIEYDWFARSVPQEKKKLYAKMKADRIVLKKTNKKLSDAYKLVLNTTYGCYKYEYCNLYDPRMANNICIGGQVMLVDLLENLEPYCKVVQSNTDGIIIIPTDEDKVKEVVKDWEERTRMVMEISYGVKIVQKDVNNYVFKKEDGSVKAVGGYVRQYKPRDLRRTLSVIDKALVEHLINDVSIEEYIHSNNDPLDYQIVSKVGKTYDRVFFESDGVQTPTNFVNRAFAGFNAGRLYKQKEGKNKEMVANHPSNTFIWDRDVSDLDMSLIDKQWYIDMTYKRLNDYMGGK
jgi:hypothetical protein